VAVIVYIHGFHCFGRPNAHKYLVVALVMTSVVTVLDDVVGISCTYLPIKASILFFMDACD
jgi:predicted esterase YcpF (UPF0227 family)